MRGTFSRRGRAAASIAVSAALLGTAASVTTSPARSDVPTNNECNEAFPVGALASGDAVTGLTVTQGTVPVAFDGQVIGVLDDGIAPGLDMVMARIDVAALGLPEVDGIWQGMSGSPVYAADGRLIGAVAYGLAYGPSAVAGITPYEAMDDHLPQSLARQVAVPHAAARAIARSTDVGVAAAAEGFSRLRTVPRVSGLTAGRVDRLRTSIRFRESRIRVKQFAGAEGGQGLASGPGDLVPGGNLGATLAHGDATIGGVGTVTAVCSGDLVGFGHPFAFLGETSLTLHPAEALYIQGDPAYAPFKVANLGAPAGVVDGDHLAGIRGSVGTPPETATVFSDVTYTPTGAQRAGSTEVSVDDYLGSATFYEHLVNHDRVLDAYTGGTEELSWRVEGHDAAGDPFELTFSDVIASSDDITFESAFELAGVVEAVAQLPGVTVDSVESTSVVEPDATTYRIKAVEQRRDGRFVPVTSRNPAVGKAGDRLRLRITLTSTTGDVERETLSFGVPRNASRRASLVVSGGGGDVLDVFGATTLAQVRRAVDGAVRGDVVSATLFTRGDGARGVEEYRFQVDRVVAGQRYVRVVVKQ